jgi:GNAT superfamily N-acetyltransferase
VAHRGFDQRRRVDFNAYIDGDRAGRLDIDLHPGGIARIRKIDTQPEYQRRGIASALFETLRAERPGLLIEHSGRWADGRAWWQQFCAVRRLDPTDPRS